MLTREDLNACLRWRYACEQASKHACSHAYLLAVVRSCSRTLSSRIDASISTYGCHRGVPLIARLIRQHTPHTSADTYACGNVSGICVCVCVPHWRMRLGFHESRFARPPHTSAFASYVRGICVCVCGCVPHWRMRLGVHESSYAHACVSAGV
jgi:hypothetical protein